MPKPDKTPARLSPPEEGAASPQGLQNVATARELFWQNVIREMLTSLSVLSASGERPKLPPAGEAGDQESTDLFDGRLAVITTLGQRIPIAAVSPLFACGIQTSDADKALSMAVECSVFQIHTPGGEVFTLPLHEIRAFHSLSEQLVEEMKEASAAQADGDHEPFGFAAYTSLARTNLPADTVKAAERAAAPADRAAQAGLPKSP